MSVSTPLSLQYLPDPGRLDRDREAFRIFVLLPTTRVYGGVLSVVNLMNILIDRGHQITIGSLSQQGLDMVFPRTEPIFIRDPERMADTVRRPFDIVMATFWSTAEPIAGFAEAIGATPVYFVQDYEPDFYADDDQRAAARATYELIPNRVVKTRYLQDRLLHEGGWASRRMRPGMDLDIFYPRRAFSERPRNVILGMARPDPAVDRRGLHVLTAVFEELYRRRPYLKLKVFGRGEASLFSCPVDALGSVEPSKLPELYSTATVFVETSRTHGFGRTSAEAMACATPCVLSDSGGVSEYARHAENCSIVPVGDVQATVEAVLSLLDDEPRREEFSNAGVDTIRHFSDYLAASDLVDALGAFVGDQQGGSDVHVSSA